MPFRAYACREAATEEYEVETAEAPAGIGRAVVLDKARNRREALEQVFERGRDALYRFILVRTGMNRDASDDLLQQTCYEAARHPSPP